MADELTPDECMAGKRKLKVKTFIRVLVEVNRQLSSRFTQHNVAFMRQMAVYTPLTLLCDDGISAKQMASKRFVISIVYRIDADETTRELADFGTPYQLFNRDGTSDEQTTAECGGKLQTIRISNISKAI